MTRLYQELLSVSEGAVAVVGGEELRITGKSRYFIDKPEDEYIKIFFEGHRVLAVGPEDEEAIFGRSVGAVTEEYPAADTIEYGGKKYKKQDRAYQRVSAFYFGDLNDVEGEVDFTDYECVGDPSLVLSIGPVMQTGKREDVFGKLVPASDIKIGDRV